MDLQFYSGPNLTAHITTTRTSNHAYTVTVKLNGLNSGYFGYNIYAYLGGDTSNQQMLKDNSPSTWSSSSSGIYERTWTNIEYGTTISFTSTYESGFTNKLWKNLNIDYDTPYYILDLNGRLDSSNVGNFSGYGKVDVYVNGSRVAYQCTDYYEALPLDSTYSITNINADTGKTYNGVYSGSLSGTIKGDTEVFLEFSTNYYWNNINAYYPDRVTEFGIMFDLIVTNSSGTVIASYNNLTNEPSSFSFPYGYIGTISNIRPLTTGTYLSSVTGATDNGNGTYSWTFTTANHAVCLYSSYYTYWNNINAYYPNGTTEGGFLFDLVVKDRSNNIIKTWTDLTNEPNASEFTYEYGYSATISNIRSNVIGAHFVSVTGATDNGDGTYSWYFNAGQDHSVNIYSSWNDIKVKKEKWYSGDVYIKINGQWRRASNIYIKNENTWKKITG